MKHKIRCEICNKFATFDDMADDGICERCEEKINSRVNQHLLTTRRLTAVLIILSTLITALAIIATRADSAEYREEYFVTGVNTTTGERVIGWVDGILGEPSFQGHIQDRLGQWVVVGEFSGKGGFLLRSMCCEYDVVVTQEVFNDKLVNRKYMEEK